MLRKEVVKKVNDIVEKAENAVELLEANLKSRLK